MQALKFLVFADLHYKQDMYATTVADLQAVIDRAAATGAELILHAGDFCNDYPGSPEIIRPLLQNPYGLAVYGCYGNHELETAGTAMTFVTPCLTNRDVCWGSADGKRGDGDIAYYYFDYKSYRFIVTDTNYSLREDGVWEHNRTGSHCPVRENTAWNSLGPDQLAWLERTLTDAADGGQTCILVSHVAFNSRKGASPDAAAVRALLRAANERRKGTVLLAINGHHHTDGLSAEDGILYFDVNAVRNAWWQATDHGKYEADTPTFPFIPYDSEGAPTAPAAMRPLRSLRQGHHTLFTEDPLSAVVTLTEDGTLEVEGALSHWVADLGPDDPNDNTVPFIRDRRIKI